MENPNKLAPKTRAQAIRRQAGALAVAGLALAGGGKAVHGALTAESAPPRPTRTVEVQPGDVGVVWREAQKFADAQNVDPRDVVDDIREASPDYADDGIVRPGNVLQVPLTDAEIAARDQADQSNG